MANIECRIKKLEQLLQKKRICSGKGISFPVFILPNDEERYQEYLRYIEAHPKEHHVPAVLLPANGRESQE
jgi:hypothetical protein